MEEENNGNRAPPGAYRYNASTAVQLGVEGKKNTPSPATKTCRIPYFAGVFAQAVRGKWQYCRALVAPNGYNVVCVCFLSRAFFTPILGGRGVCECVFVFFVFFSRASHVVLLKLSVCLCFVRMCVMPCISCVFVLVFEFIVSAVC